MNRETLIRQLSGATAKSTVDVDKLIHLIFKYFGEHDAELVLQIALFFKYPGCYQWVGKTAIKRLEEELA